MNIHMFDDRLKRHQVFSLAVFELSGGTKKGTKWFFCNAELDVAFHLHNQVPHIGIEPRYSADSIDPPF